MIGLVIGIVALIYLVSEAIRNRIELSSLALDKLERMYRYVG